MLTIFQLLPFLVGMIFGSTRAEYVGLTQNLPTSTTPYSYDITIEPHVEAKTFSGNVSVELKCYQPTTTVTLHAVKLEILKDGVTLRNSDDVINPTVKVELDWLSEKVMFTFEQALKAMETYNLEIVYSAELREDNQGFYWGTYMDEKGVEKYFANTNLIKTNARSVFPCFDEVDIKSSFTIRIVRSNKFKSFSNEEKDRTEDLGAGRFLDVYKPVHNISTYLVAFAVCDFDFVREGLHAVVARPDLIKAGRATFALDTAPILLKAVEEYVDANLTSSKIDHIAIPDEYFAGEAMENLGLINYKESLLLVTKEDRATMEEQAMLTSMLHELLHQWFGNYVTPAEWNYWWVSEGMATYLQFRLGDSLKPEWKLLEQFQNLVVERAYEGEVYQTHNALNARHQRKWVAYLKAAAIIRMLEHAITPEIFQKGLRKYVKIYKYGTVKPVDLYQQLQGAVDEYGDFEYVCSVEDMMKSWDSGKLYPVVNVERNYEDGKVILEQDVFSYFKQVEPDHHIWYIPINYVTNASSSGDFSITTPDYWLFQKRETLNATFPPEDWLIINKQSTGYYRVNYDVTNWEKLTYVLSTLQFKNIHVLNRAQLVTDSFALARYGRLDYKIPLGLSAYLFQETDYVPITSFLNEIEFLNTMLTLSDDIYPIFKKYVVEILQGLLDNQGYEETATEDHLAKQNRANLLKWLCALGHGKSREHALSKLRSWRSEDKPIPKTLRETLLCGAVRAADQEDWDFLFAKYEGAKNSSERAYILKALGCSENEDVVNRFLKKIQEDVLESDRTSAFISVIESGPVGLNLTRNYVRANIKELWNVANMETVLTIIGTRSTTTKESDDLRAFKNEFRGVHMAFRPGMEYASINAEWTEKNVPQIKKWFTTGPNTNVEI